MRYVVTTRCELGKQRRWEVFAPSSSEAIREVATRRPKHACLNVDRLGFEDQSANITPLF